MNEKLIIIIIHRRHRHRNRLMFVVLVLVDAVIITVVSLAHVTRKNNLQGRSLK
jgi:hypothetical protein